MGEHIQYAEGDDQDVDDRIDDHLSEALEHVDDERAAYHIREALGLLRL